VPLPVKQFMSCNNPLLLVFVRLPYGLRNRHEADTRQATYGVNVECLNYQVTELPKEMRYEMASLACLANYYWRFATYPYLGSAYGSSARRQGQG
jgi:hypothetical protein